MDIDRFPDNVHLLVVLLLLVAIMLAFIEAGYRLGCGPGKAQSKAQVAQVRAIMGATLGLLAFMLAFAFSAGQSHFDARTEGVLYETNVVTQAYRAAEMLDEPARSEARGLLRSFVDLRIDTYVAMGERRLDDAVRAVVASEEIHDRLWELATRLDENGVGERGIDLFTSSVLELMNTHRSRVQAALYNRIPPIIWLTLLFMAILSMLTMGYQAGLSGARSRIATWTLAVAFSAVMILIMDLDRPVMTLFNVNNQIMIDLRAQIGAD